MNEASRTHSKEIGRTLLKIADKERHDLFLFTVLGVLGTAASYFSVNIPHTAVFIEIRYAFGFMGFALLRRREYALILACLLMITGPHKVPLGIVFAANLLYVAPGPDYHTIGA